MKKHDTGPPKTFANFFRQKRLSLGFTLRSFCETYNYDPGNVSKLERGIVPPSTNRQKLEGYALALKIPRESEDWVRFFDLAYTARGKIPEDIIKSPQILSFLPAFYRTARGEKLDKKKIKKLIALLSEVKK